MNADDAGFLLRAARDKVVREVPVPTLAPGTVMSVVTTQFVTIAKVSMDGPQALSKVLDVPVVGAGDNPSVGARVFVYFTPPMGATVSRTGISEAPPT